MRGLKFRKLDLHIHTPASRDFNRPPDMSDEAIAAAMVEMAISKGLDAIAITDHNSAGWIDVMKQAATGRQLIVFPGVEITATGGKSGIHIIALFDPSKDERHVTDLLSKLGLKPEEHGMETTVVQKTPTEVVAVIAEVGALPVLAHVNSSRGVLADMSGIPRILTIQHPLLRAAEGTDYDNAEKKATKRRAIDWLDGTDPNYKKKLAVYQSSDNLAPESEGGHCIEGIAGRSSFFKMEQIDLIALRNCFEDPDVRIRHYLDETDITCPRIVSVEVTGGFLDELKLALHGGLNTIIGGKGAGKSLLVEFLRFALDQRSNNPHVLEDHNSKLSERLNTYGSIKVTLLSETRQEITLERQYNPEENNPFTSGGDVNIARLFPVLFLSQNEIIKIAENEDEQLSFIDRFFDFQSHLDNIVQLERELKSLDKQFAESISAFIEGVDLQKRITTLETEIKGIDEALKNPTFEKFAKLDAKQRALRASTKYAEDLIGKVENAKSNFLDQPLPVYSNVISEDPTIKRAGKLLSDTRAFITQKFRELLDGLELSKSSLATEEEESSKTYATVKKDYEEVVLTTGGNYQAVAAKRLRLVKELEDLQTRQGKVKELSDKAGPLSEERVKRLDLLSGAYFAYSQERRLKCEKFESESGGKLKITISESSNVDVFKDRMAELKRGSYLRDADVERICEAITPREFIHELMRYAVRRVPARLKALAEKAGVQLDWLTTLANYFLDSVSLENLLELQYKAVPQDRPDIQYALSDRSYSPLARLSVGQKCTAMLIMALSDGNMPIVIDQPEDSLDIKSIWDDVCVKLRRGKEGRQFIFTTHNSSLAVASDTDYFVVIEADASHGSVNRVGAMDHDPVNSEVLDYLEGGFDTYKRKYVKYDAERRLKDN